MGDEANITLSEQEKRARLRLIRSTGIGPSSFERLVAAHGSAVEAIDYLLHSGKQGKIASTAEIEKEYDAYAEKGIKLLFHGTQEYPSRLAAIPDAPPVLIAKGDVTLFEKQNIGVVGARNASAGGIKLTRRICKDLAEANIVVTSGLARGIDTAAHEASLTGGTIACLAGGIDYIYPPQNEQLYDAIAETGLLVSEMPLGTKPQARHFPRRNRIISGLCSGLLVVEAARKSGSLITARYAADQGRDVFAIPGSPLDPRAQGTNQLIKDGAVLTQSADDILNELASMPLLRATVKPAAKPRIPVQSTLATKATEIPASQEGLLKFLSPDPIHIDEIVRLTGVPTEKILGEFMALELAGEIIRHGGNRFSRISTKNE